VIQGFNKGAKGDGTAFTRATKDGMQCVRIHVQIYSTLYGAKGDRRAFTEPNKNGRASLQGSHEICVTPQRTSAHK